jgi:serine phosphatase RsbU (regulator of sigma subunit)
MPGATQSETIVVLVPAGVDRDSSLHRLEQSLACWHGQAPRIAVVTVEDLEASGAGCLPEAARIVVLACQSASRAGPVLRLLGASGPDLPPPVILQQEPPAYGPNTERIVVSWDDPPAMLAGVLMGSLHAGAALAQHTSDHDLTARTAATVARELERHQDELHLAVQVQRDLLPALLPNHQRGRFAVIYRPGTSLSGDTYDAQCLDEHHVGLFIADACGHGIAAAFLMTLVSRMLAWRDHDRAPTHGADPAAIIARLNAALCGRRGGMLSPVSAACAVIDTRDGTARIAVAGHPPPIIAAPTDRPGDGSLGRLLTGGGPLLGVLDEAVYENMIVQLNPGDTFILHTDGFEHVFPPAELHHLEDHRGPQRPAVPSHPDTGTPEYVRMLARLGEPGKPLEQAVRELDAEMLTRRGSLHQVDDITLLAFRYEAASCADLAEPSPAWRCTA